MKLGCPRKFIKTIRLLRWLDNRNTLRWLQLNPFNNSNPFQWVLHMFLQTSGLWSLLASLLDFCHLKAKSKTANACTLMTHRESNSLLRHYDCLAWPSEPFHLWPSVPLSPLMGCSWRQWNHSRPLTAQSPITDHRTKSPLDQKSQASYEPPSYVLNHIWL